MPHKVQVASGQHQIQLPDGLPYDEGDIITLTDEQFANLDPNAIGTVLVDLGTVDPADAVSVQAGNIAAMGALTSANAAGGTPTAAEHNAVVADLVAMRTKLNALIADLTGAGKPMHT
jgi:hypothetical protein